MPAIESTVTEQCIESSMNFKSFWIQFSLKGKHERTVVSSLLGRNNIQRLFDENQVIFSPFSYLEWDSIASTSTTCLSQARLTCSSSQLWPQDCDTLAYLVEWTMRYLLYLRNCYDRSSLSGFKFSKPSTCRSVICVSGRDMQCI